MQNIPHRSRSKSRLDPRFTIILAMLFWGASFPAMKYSISQFNPYFVVWARLAIGMCCLLPFISKHAFKNYQKGDWLLLSAMVLFEPGIYFFFEINALKLTTATQAGFIASTLPLMVIVSGALILKELIRVQSVIGVIIAFTGAILLTVSSETSHTAPNPILGNFLEVLAMLAATGFTLILKKVGDRYSPLFLTFLQTLGGAILFSPILLINRPSVSFLLQNPNALAILLFLGIVVTVLAYAFYISGIQKIPANEGILFVNLIPVFGLILSVLFLNESLSLQQSLACIILLCGVGIGQLKSKRLPNPGAESA